MKFLGGATTLELLSQSLKASKTKGFFPMSGLITRTHLIFPELLPYETFFSKLRNNNPLDKDFVDYEKLKTSGLDEQQALKKLEIKTVHPSGLDNYNYLQETWTKNGMTVFKDFRKWKCFIDFVQSVVDARREGDENPLSGVVAETLGFLGNSSYGYQIMDRSRHTVTKYLNDQKTHKAINEPFL